MKYSGIIFGLAGAGVGICTGYYLAKKKYINQADKDVESIKRYYEKKYPNIKEDPNPANDLKDNVNFIEKAESFKASYQQDQERYEKEVAMYHGDHDGDDNQVVDIPAKVEKVTKKKKVKTAKEQFDYIVISDNEFKESTNYSSTIWHYIDGEIADDELHLLCNIMEGIGEDINLYFNENPDIDVMYIRSRALNQDFEVMHTNEHYGDVRLKTDHD